MGVIYIATNKINGKSYIGQTTKNNFLRRKKGHINEAKKRKTIFHNALLKYDPDNFEWKTLIICEMNELDYYEIECIRVFKTLAPNGYNAETGGNKNKQASQETKNKQSKMRKGKLLSEKHKESLKEARKYVIMSEETKNKISIANLGKTLTLDHKQKISKARTGKYIGEKSPNYGKHLSDERKEKISQTKKKNNLIALKNGKRNCKTKLTINDVVEIKELIEQGTKLDEIAKQFNVIPATISHIKVGRTWKGIELFINKNKNET